MPSPEHAWAPPHPSCQARPLLSPRHKPVARPTHPLRAHAVMAQAIRRLVWVEPARQLGSPLLHPARWIVGVKGTELMTAAAVLMVAARRIKFPLSMQASSLCSPARTRSDASALHPPAPSIPTPLPRTHTHTDTHAWPSQPCIPCAHLLRGNSWKPGMDAVAASHSSLTSTSCGGPVPSAPRSTSASSSTETCRMSATSLSGGRAGDAMSGVHAAGEGDPGACSQMSWHRRSHQRGKKSEAVSGSTCNTSGHCPTRRASPSRRPPAPNRHTRGQAPPRFPGEEHRSSHAGPSRGPHRTACRTVPPEFARCEAQTASGTSSARPRPLPPAWRPQTPGRSGPGAPSPGPRPEPWKGIASAPPPPPQSHCPLWGVGDGCLVILFPM